MPPTAAEAMAARFRAARAGPDEAVLEGFHALKHALRFGADVRLVAAAVLAGAAGHVVLLEDPRHLGNVGAVVRVGAAAGAGGVLTTGARDPWDPAALRGSAGLHFALPVARLGDAETTDPLARLPAGRALVALDPDGEPLRPGTLPPAAVLAFGTERHGLGEELLSRANARVAIPMRPGVSSLNLATAVAVVLYACMLGPA